MLWTLALVPMFVAALLMAVRPQRRAALALVSGLGLAATWLLVAIAASQGWTGSLPWSATLTLRAALTPLSALVAGLVPAVAIAVLVYASLQEREAGLVRLIGLLLFFCGAMELLVIADDLLTVLIGWEIVGACSWALIAHDWRDLANPRAARYAFVMTRFGDLGLFIAAMAVYAGAGSFAFADLARLDPTHLSLVAFGVLLSAASKSGQLPFSPWLFRAMRGPSSASALLHAATMVAAGAYLLARLQPMLSPVSGFAPAVMAIGLATALGGGVVALLQSDVKKVLAASTSAHFGLMFVAVGAGFPGIAVLHLVAHGFLKALLFLASGVAIERSGSHELNDMRLGGALPAVAALAAVGAAALAGLPPLGAGWTKDAIVVAAAAAGPWWLAGVVVAGGLSAAYAVRWLWLAYGVGASEADGEGKGEDKGMREDQGQGDDSDHEQPSPAPAVLASLGWLALASAALSVLWLPGVVASLAARLSFTPPTEPAWLIGIAVLAVAAGALAGRLMALRHPMLGQQGPAARVADWWRLPRLIELAVSQPVTRLAQASARVDDGVIDAVPRAFGRAGRHLASLLSGLDTRVVDLGVRLTTSFVEWLSRSTSRIGERVADGIAFGPAQLVALGGKDAQRLQTGLSHHALAVLLVGALCLGAILFATGL